MTIASLFGACKSNSADDLQTNKISMPDTTGAYRANASGDTSSGLQRGVRPIPVSNSRENPHNSSNASTTSDQSTSEKRHETTTTTSSRKKGWSGKAKGAVIGGAAGAVGGALISKHKGTGAVVGGLAGAAGGYIIGNEVDRKNNR